MASELPCACCQARTGQRIRIDREVDPRTLMVCVRCLRSSMVMQAASSEQRGGRILRQYAEEYGLHLWRSGHAMYLLPDTAPFEEAPLVVR